MTLVVLEVVVGQEHLRDNQMEPGKQFFVGRHQARLADGRARL